MKKLLILLLLIPAYLTVSGQIVVKENTKVLSTINKTKKDSVELTIPHYLYIPNERVTKAEPVKASIVEVQLDWFGFTDTLNSTVQVYQRTTPTSSYFLLDPVKSTKTLSSASGNYLFTWSKWAGSGLKIVFQKLKADSGAINVAVGVR
jgi:hypothetical protein